MLYKSIREQAKALTESSLFSLPSLKQWKKDLPTKRNQWLEMLGINKIQRTDLKATITGRLQRDEYIVEKFHFQPFPDCRIAANLYLPKHYEGTLPTVIYVCGHCDRAKFYYQQHPRWFAEHGYASLIIDPINSGENNGFHHGIHKENWWHWFSQGYSPASVETWTVVRAIDYLCSRPEIDPKRIGITGHSGGGTTSWFAGAADTRLKVVAPSCQTGNIYQHILEKTLDGHCDCSFWVNTYSWDFTDIASLIAPRPLQINSAAEDCLFRPYAYRDLEQRIRKLYIAYGEEEKLSLVEDSIPHGYSRKNRLAIFNWFERYLKGATQTTNDDVCEHMDSEEDLAVYPDKKPPQSDKLSDIHARFIPSATLPDIKTLNYPKKYQTHKLQTLKELSFRHIPKTFGTSHVHSRSKGEYQAFSIRCYEFESEVGIRIAIQAALPAKYQSSCNICVGAMIADERSSFLARGAGNHEVNGDFSGYACVETRGTGSTSIGPGLEWMIRRAYTLLGKTLPERRTFDLLAAISVLRSKLIVKKLAVYGTGETAALAIYAALLDENIDEIILENPVETHWDKGPEFLNVLKVGDIPHNLSLMFPRRITFVGKIPKSFKWTCDFYKKFGKSPQINSIAKLSDWR